MFIQTEATDNANIMKFLPGQEVYAGGPVSFESQDAAAQAPLARRLFGVTDVQTVEIGTDSVTVTKSDTADWLHLKPAVLGAIMDHFVTGDEAVNESSDGSAAEADIEGLELDESDPIVGEIKELIETRIRPAATQGGGDIKLRGYKEGVVYIEFVGGAAQMQSGVENMLRHYIPEVVSVADWRDAIPKPGLDTDEGRAIQEVLETRINPSVAGHGGRISLIDVDGARAYIRMEGGCQGCGMASVTLKEGVVVEIQKVVPTIREVLDVTDHAGGSNPYYQA
jgi:Fe-S cluster biogenesis protein NfuA